MNLVYRLFQKTTTSFDAYLVTISPQTSDHSLGYHEASYERDGTVDPIARRRWKLASHDYLHLVTSGAEMGIP